MATKVPAVATAASEEEAPVGDESWPTIVIGSGMGGLSVASLLSQCQEDDRRVLVLEQHPFHAGGCCQSFERDGYRFGVGVHFVSEMEEGREAKKMMDALTLKDDPIEWTPMKDLGDVMIGRDKLKTYKFDEINSTLVDLFPNEKESIEKLMAMSKKAAACWFRALWFKALPRWVSSFIVKTQLDRLLNPNYRKYARTTFGEVLRSLNIEDPDLKTILCGGCYAYGMSPDEAPFIMQALFLADEEKPSVFYYPTGGPGQISGKIIRAIEDKGGKVHVNSAVSKILVENSRAVGVQLADGKKINATKQVISDAGFVTTFRHLVPKECQPSRRMLAASADNNVLKNGMTGISLFVGLQGEYDNDFNVPSNLSVETPKTISLPSTLEGLAALKAEDLSLYITCPSRKDGSWKSECTGKTTLEIMLMNVPWKAFEGLIDEAGIIRDEKKVEYDNFKNKFGQLIWARTRQALVEAGATKLPEKLEDADFSELGTPLTFHHFLGSDRGAWYGLEHNCGRFHPRNYYLRLRPECDINGLYLTGEDVATDGVQGALCGGYLCAAKILGVRNPTNLVEKVQKSRIDNA